MISDHTRQACSEDMVFSLVWKLLGAGDQVSFSFVLPVKHLSGHMIGLIKSLCIWLVK